MKKSKSETLEEFLARGGKITKVDFHKPEAKEQATRQAPGGPANILTYEDAELFYGEQKVRKAKPKSKVDLSALPEALKAKFIAKLSEEIQEEADEDDDE